jgi:hypothetical protein
MHHGGSGLSSLFQDAAHRSAPNLQTPGDFRLAEAVTVELPNLVGVDSGREWAP